MYVWSRLDAVKTLHLSVNIVATLSKMTSFSDNML